MFKQKNNTEFNIVGLIPARGGSKRLKNKNIMKLFGHPLMCYTLEAAKQSKLLTDFYVTTEDRKIKKTAIEYGAKVIDRPSIYSRDNSSIVGALSHAVKHIEADGKRGVDVVVWLQPNMAFREKGAIDEVIRLFFRSGASSVRTVVESRHCAQLAIFIDDKMNMRRPYISKYSKKYRKQQYKTAYYCDGSVMVFYRDNLFDPPNKQLKEFYMGKKSKVYIQPDHYGVEIDEPVDLFMADFIHTKFPDLIKDRVKIRK